MDPFEDRTFALIRKILSFLGFWHTQPYRERILRYSIIGSLLIYSILLQLCPIFTLDFDLQSIVMTLQIFIPSISFGAIYCSFILHFVPIRSIFSYITQDWQRLENDVDLKIMRKHAYLSKLFILISGLVILALCSWVILPVVIRKILFGSEEESSTDRFPVATCIDYFLDREAYYYLISVQQIILLSVAVVVAIGCYAAHFLIIQHICALLTITKGRINQMFQNNDHNESILVTPIDLSHWLIGIVQRFARIREFMELVNDLSEKCYLFQMSLAFLLVVVAFLCVFQIPVLLEDKEKRKFTVEYLFFIVGSISTIYLNCYIGQRVMDYSTDLYREACLIPIHDISLKTQKLLLTTLMMNAKPCSISIGKVFVSSHEFFSDLLRTSLSFAMVLHSTKNIQV